MSKKNLHEDKYHNTDLSYAIEEGKFEQIKTLLDIQGDISYPDLLKLVGMRAHKNELEKDFIVSKEAQQRIFYEAKDQLDLLGEDSSDLSDLSDDE